MDPQTLLLSGISAVTAALVFVARLLWVKVEACEVDRVTLRTEQNNIRQEYIDYVKSHSEQLTKVIEQNTIALERNTAALKAINAK